MKLYECTVRLNGEQKNEVRKEDVTAAEIVILKALHNTPQAGVEAVVNIKLTGEKDTDDNSERERPFAIYGEGVSHSRFKSLDTILGHPSIPLPTSVPGVDEPPKSGRVARVKAKEPEVAPVDEPEPTETPAFE